MSRATRRRFLEDSMLTAAAVALANSAPIRADEPQEAGQGQRLRVAIVGCGIRGKQHAHDLSEVPNVEIVYVCDADSQRAAELAASVEQQQGSRPRAVQDMRRIFDDDSVEAVFIAAPDHWHGLAALWAMQAGKDVYVEKPVSHNIAEGQRLVEAARKLNRICQAGTQYRSNGANANAIQYIRDGKLGEVKFARSLAYRRREPIGGPGHYEIPVSVDYNLYVGPAPMSPLARPNFHYDWHWFWDTGSGELGNLNIHTLDICRWGLGLNDEAFSVRSYGGRFGFHDAGQTPNTEVVMFDFGDKSIIAETRNLKSQPFVGDVSESWIFEGSEGYIAGSSLFDLDGKLISTFSGPLENHFGNFLKAVRSRRREDLNADILEGHRSTTLCHVGNISWRLGRQTPTESMREELARLGDQERALETLQKTIQHLQDHHVDLDQTPLTLGPLLEFDPQRAGFASNAQADVLLKRTYRQPFELPELV
ncbi:MAG: Gfo/Idh/MocA family oxidoreductase [Pirellulaceae bacterium]|jgi:predicted dehydrogenase|nr:Gfo/Idh/MocA family oxidoreductase [Pirellulaceae bacterium]